jgi:hypothetical protein
VTWFTRQVIQGSRIRLLRLGEPFRRVGLSEAQAGRRSVIADRYPALVRLRTVTSSPSCCRIADKGRITLFTGEVAVLFSAVNTRSGGE